jgi:hypothetical protein
MTWGRLASAAAVVVAAAIGVAALFDAVRGDPPASPVADPRPEIARLSGRDVPPPGALAGRLVFAESAGCRLRVLDLRSLALGRPGPATGCRLWVSPRGDLAVVTGATGDRALALVGIDGEQPLVLRRLGEATSPPTWSVDGARLAWCTGTSTTLLDVVSGRTDRRPGCYPAFSPDGSLVTRSVTENGLVVLRNGQIVTQPEQAAERHVVGHGVLPDGRLLVAIQSRRDEAVLELWRGEALERTLPIQTYGMIAQAFAVRLDLVGETEVAVTAPSNLSALRPDNLVSSIDFRDGRPADGLAERPSGGVAFSPDGAWVAFSTGGEILVFAGGASEPLYTLPVAAGAVAWR